MYYAYIDVDNCINVKKYEKTYRVHHQMMHLRKMKHVQEFIEPFEADTVEDAIECVLEYLENKL